MLNQREDSASIGIRDGRERPGHGRSSFGRGLCDDAQTMTSTLGRLARAGFIIIVPNPDDGRAKFVRMTPKGVAMRHRCIAALAPVLTDLQRTVAPKDLENLLPRLVRLRSILDQKRV